MGILSRLFGKKGKLVVGEALVLTESSVHSKGEHSSVDVLKGIALPRLKYIISN